jgi:hypothetical protein
MNNSQNNQAFFSNNSNSNSLPVTPKTSANRIVEKHNALLRLVEEPSPESRSMSNSPLHFASNNGSATGEYQNYGVLQCATVFFTSIHRASETIYSSRTGFVTNLLQITNTEVNDLLNEVNSVLKEARNTFRKNSDICRLSEAAIGNFMQSLQLTYDSVSAAGVEEITDLTDELTKLRGGMSFIPSVFEHLLGDKSVPAVVDAEVSTTSSASQQVTSSAMTTTTNATTATTTTTTAPEESTPRANSNDQVVVASSSSKKNRTSFLSVPSISGKISNPSNIESGNIPKKREDMWLSVQRYKVAVKDSQEALCVLISESMDLELQQQILTNRVHNTFNYIIENYFNEEITLSSDIDTILVSLLKNIQRQIDVIGIPNPILQSPFAKLNPAFFMSESLDSERRMSQGISGSQSLSIDQLESTTGDNNNNDSNNSITPSKSHGHVIARTASTQEYDDFMNSVGIFSFTTLFKEQLPMNPGVVKSGYLLSARSAEVKWNENVISSLLSFSAIEIEGNNNNNNNNEDNNDSVPMGWKKSYVIATSDGYLHILCGKKTSDLPDRSFYIKVSSSCFSFQFVFSFLISFCLL